TQHLPSAELLSILGPHGNLPSRGWSVQPRERPPVDSFALVRTGAVPNAGGEPRPEAGAQRKREGGGATALVLIGGPSSAYHRGMLVVGKVPKKRRRPSMWPQLSSPLEHFFLSLSLLLLSWCALDWTAHILVASASELASHLTRPVTVSASCIPRTRLTLALIPCPCSGAS